jgi:hypothetical protein
MRPDYFYCVIDERLDSAEINIGDTETELFHLRAAQSLMNERIEELENE